MLFHPSWHFSAVICGNICRVGVRQGSLPQSQFLFAAAVPGFGQLDPALGPPAFRIATVIIDRPQVAQGAVQALDVVPPNHSVQRVLC